MTLNKMTYFAHDILAWLSDSSYSIIISKESPEDTQRSDIIITTGPQPSLTKAICTSTLSFRKYS